MHPPAPEVPVLAVVPFALMLLGIAILPLVVPRFWESNRNKGMFTAVLGVPMAIYLWQAHPEGLLESLHEYVSFVALLGSLYVISGGIHLAGDIQGTPGRNTFMLGIGAVLANFIGTTGASMVLIRIMLRTNHQRRRVGHLPFFFVLLVSNCGGLLTPLGDPPLFLGFLRGVPFTWTLRLWPAWLLVVGYLLTVFYLLDRHAYRRESRQALAADVAEQEPMRLVGYFNIALLAGVVGSVFLPTPWRELAMLALVIASLTLGSKQARELNQFTWHPIEEVAVLFAGIFVTMVPALALLQAHGGELGLTRPWHFFLVTGGLSSMLDNAPTYLTFLSAAQGMGLEPEVVGIPEVYLAAISIGAVFMGANTYIGNGPNFMVKAIAEESGYPMPSFFGYALRSFLVLAPVYVIVSWQLG